MKIIEPNIELWKQTDEVSYVARCARICYRKESGNDERLIQNLKLRKHLSMFRHFTYYYIMPAYILHSSYKTTKVLWIADLCKVINTHQQIVVGIDIRYANDNYYIVANGQWVLEHSELVKPLDEYELTAEEFFNYDIVSYNMMRYTFKVTTQISTSRELNRVSPNNIAEQSTRYVYEDGTICRPHWMTEEEADYLNTKEILDDDWINNHDWAKRYIWTTDNSFDKYRMLVDYSKMPRQDARGVLPLDTATICAYTYSVNEWRDIIDLRYYGITGQPHPNAKIAAGMIRKELIELGYEFR